jgi:glycosyltransferase involved in cell wall biosynthesis
MNKELKRVCLIATEMRGFGAYGGFGVLTYDIARGLAERGLDVYVAMPRQKAQKPIEKADGVTVLSYPSPLYVGLKETLPFAGLYRALDADIYHSQEPSVGTRLAQIAAPKKRHIVTFQDPRTIEDWRKQSAPYRASRLSEWKFLWRYQRESGEAARRADARYCQAKYIVKKARAIYRLAQDPGFLPNPVEMSTIRHPKEPGPTVCFVGRWDPIKRPELFLELASRFMRVKFVIAGDCLNDPKRRDYIRQRCKNLPNVESPGWLGAEERDAILDKSWIMANTSTKECLPISYLEAGAHKCAILSHGNADDFASSFGFWAQKGDLDDYAQGLQFLLENDRWKALGEKAYGYVKETHEYERVIDRHLRVYEEVLQS